MIDETLDFAGCDDVCGKIESLSLLELSFNGFITGSVSAPLK